MSAVTAAAGDVAATLVIGNSLIANNLTGVAANGNAATVRVGSSVITGNTNAVGVANSGVVMSYKNNEIDGNTSAQLTRRARHRNVHTAPLDGAVWTKSAVQLS